MQNALSFRRVGDSPVFTAYLNPRAYIYLML